MQSYNALTYDDITLVPKFSEIESRQNIDLTTQLSKNYKIKIPLIASPMDTVCESEMANAMAKMGGVGCIHRFMSIESQAHEVRMTHLKIYGDGFGGIYEQWEYEVPIAVAVGANNDYLERAKELTKAGANVIFIDVAHGHHKFVKDALYNLKKELPSHVDVIAGNIATAEAAKDLESWGADGLRVGIGGGSLCTTRIKTGFGIPNVSSLLDVASVASVPIIADGGIRSSGDVAKALACGADSGMLGSLLAGAEETPGQIIEKPNGLFKKYRGAASLETKSFHHQAKRNVEGESTIVSYKGSVKFIIENLADGIRSAFSYAGALNCKQFNPEYVVTTQAGQNEARPHLLL